MRWLVLTLAATPPDRTTSSMPVFVAQWPIKLTGNLLEHPLVCRRYVDHRELGRQMPGEIDVLTLMDREGTGGRAIEATQQRRSEQAGLTVGGEPDDLSSVADRIEEQYVTKPRSR